MKGHKQNIIFADQIWFNFSLKGPMFLPFTPRRLLLHCASTLLLKLWNRIKKRHRWHCVIVVKLVAFPCWGIAIELLFYWLFVIYLTVGKFISLSLLSQRVDDDGHTVAKIQRRWSVFQIFCMRIETVMACKDHKTEFTFPQSHKAVLLCYYLV